MSGLRLLTSSENRLFLFLILTLFIVIPLDAFCIHGSPKDTTIITYWVNGNKKMETSYRKISVQNKNNGTPATILKVKKVKYYNSAGESVSKRDFYFFHSNDDFFDSLEYKMNEKIEKFKSKPSVKLMLGDSLKGIYFPMNITFNPQTEIYKEKDTLIRGYLYSICIYKKDTLSKLLHDPAKTEFIGALRSDRYKIYYYNTLTGKEELAMDYEAIANEFGKAVSGGLKVVAQATAEVASETSKAIHNVSGQALAFTLANIIFMLK